MRFIGSKVNLLEDIREMVKNNCTGAISFCDIFSGTTNVARFFKKDFSIISNDLLHFSFVLQKATIENNIKPNFSSLKKNNIEDPLKYLNEFEPKIEDLKSEPFIFNNYTPNHNHDRSYFSKDNALKIDFIRQKIEEWKNDKLIEENEYYYLIACLIEAVPFVSNIAGTFGAYLKHWNDFLEKKHPNLHSEGKNNTSKPMMHKVLKEYPKKAEDILNLNQNFIQISEKRNQTPLAHGLKGITTEDKKLLQDTTQEIKKYLKIKETSKNNVLFLIEKKIKCYLKGKKQ